jgi:lysophospholipase L1-like esterase
MKILCNTFLFALCLLLTSKALWAQQPRFAEEIQAFKKADSINFPPVNAIVFTGSSSIRLWKDIDKTFPGHTIINRGFGGSSLPDVIHYTDEVIFAYKPKQIIIYCGDNDLASSDTITAQSVYERFVQLFTLIRSRMPEVDIDYISIKPSPRRAHLMPKAKQTNALIKAYLEKEKNAHFINIFDVMLDKNGQPRAELFLEDRLHMKPEGYNIWQKAIRPYLLK